MLPAGGAISNIKAAEPSSWTGSASTVATTGIPSVGISVVTVRT